MKSLATVVVLLCSVFFAQAQRGVHNIAYQSNEVKAIQTSLLLQHHAPEFQDGFKIPGERMKKTGSTLTIIGGALFVGGIILTSQGGTEYDPYTGMEVADDKLVLGVTMLVGGAGMMIPGIIFWSKGAKKYNRYMEQQQSLSFKLRGPGVSLAYRF